MHLLFRFGTVVAAWLGALVGLILLLPLGLLVVEWLIWPLALIIAALLAALSAGWTGTLLASDQTRTALVPVIGVTVMVAVGAALLFLQLVRLGMVNFGPLIVPALLLSLCLALTAGVATWRYRRPHQARTSDRTVTAVLLLLAVVSVPVTVFLASLWGLAGA